MMNRSALAERSHAGREQKAALLNGKFRGAALLVMLKDSFAAPMEGIHIDPARKFKLNGKMRSNVKKIFTIYSHSANSSIGVLIYNGSASKTFANMLMICVCICDCFNF